MALRDQPYLPLYVQDFLTDEKLMECSASATGIYIKIMCIMHKSNEYGTISLKEKDNVCQSVCYNFAKKLVRFLPYPDTEINNALQELISEGVLSIEGNKLIQKRMVRDNEISIKRSEAGSKGGFAKANNIAKEIANTENENEDIIEDKNKINVPFENFWNLYDKKVDRKKCEPKWNRLSNLERSECIEKLPAYISSTPDKRFRRDPETYLNNKSWENEIISPNPVKVTPTLTYEEMLKLTDKNPDLWKQYRAVKRDGERKAVFIPINQ